MIDQLKLLSYCIFIHSFPARIYVAPLQGIHSGALLTQPKIHTLNLFCSYNKIIILVMLIAGLNAACLLRLDRYEEVC